MNRIAIMMLLAMSFLSGCKCCEWQVAACMPCPYSLPYFSEYNYMPVPIPITMGPCPPGAVYEASTTAPSTPSLVPPAPAAEEPAPTPLTPPPAVDQLPAPVSPPEFLPPVPKPPDAASSSLVK